MSNIWEEKPGIQWQTREDADVDVLEDEAHNLIVWNDSVNTFDWVIESLIDVCEQSPEQAEQCALIIHHKGKYGVRKGSFDELRPKAEALIDRGIQATIDY
ncbi:MAG: ATP-dependent Clp protease adaptor ClpS [Sphingobacteriales bacterium]|nr:MAG: ATP-dependent Clp protease adaptor ClpS [Sphingobacteriales bacterium]